MSKLSKKDMIFIMQENGWYPTSTTSNSYSDVKSEYETYLDEISSDIDMFPNGRDFEAEDEDGPF